MQINADFAQRVLLHTAQMPWVDSPVPGVQRRMLDRLGDEVARATSVVRYAPNSQFTPHTHGGGEEFIVLDGVFQDEHGDFPTGSYIRNPPTSRHTPGSHTGCVIFVKLWQFDPADRTSLRLDMHQVARVPDLLRSGVTVAPLFQDAHETVQLEVWSPGAQIDMHYAGGAELLVIKGDVMSMGDALPAQSWLRLPIGAHLSATAGPQGASVWVKTGHLRFIQAPPV
jgi:anti-sigma factor ChrR (cupin superfamily)